MKKFLSIGLTALLAISLLSWGVLGHKTVAKIAEAHLSPAARQAVEYYLGNQTLPDIASYADEIRAHDEYKYTGPWHYIDLPGGYDFEQFSAAVGNMKEDNVYSALTKCENDLRDPSKSKEEKAFALKLVVHFVGDLHQPMHVSRAEDKGGNTIKVTFNGQDANLHSLWDSRLIEHQGLDFEQLASKYDNATPEQIRQWQSDDLMKWLYESYQISTQLYADAAGNPNFDEAYYKAHLSIIQQRIEKAGIRLAGVLNNIFSSPLKLAAPAPGVSGATPSGTTSASTICDKVYSATYFDNSQMTLLNLGGTYPDQKLTIMIKGDDRAKFKIAPETAFMNKNVCVTGVVTEYKGKPEIIVTDPSQIVVKE